MCPWSSDSSIAGGSYVERSLWPEDFARRYHERGCWRNITFGEQLDAAIARSGDKETLVFVDERITHRELGARVGRLLVRLSRAGLKPLDRAVLQPPIGGVESMETNEKAAA